jgi:hypothetical protein
MLMNVYLAAAQDSIPIIYSEEPDTLIVRQKFIDRYDNVFMTRVATSNVIKAGYTSSDVQGIGTELGYEYKVWPALSIEAQLYKKTNNAGDGIYMNTFTKQWSRDWWLGIKARWYYNMGKRIKSGLNANNFSGGYLSALVDRRLGDLDWSSPVNSHRYTIGITTGFQSRVFNRGHIDISLGAYRLNQLKYFAEYPDPYFVRKSRNTDFILSTQMTVGIAFGDWKREVPTAVCEVLLCDEEVQNQWKLRFPEASLGLGQRSLRFGIAREAKFGRSPLSIDINANAEFYDTELANMKGYFVKIGLQGRYYLLQPMQIRRGKAGNNLSGFYTGLEIANFLTKRTGANPTQSFNERYWGATLSAGFQQRLFKNIFVDSAISVNEFSSEVPYYYGTNFRRISAKLALGFTF